jgi:hypothetical protein
VHISHVARIGNGTEDNHILSFTSSPMAQESPTLQEYVVLKDQIDGYEVDPIFTGAGRNFGLVRDEALGRSALASRDLQGRDDRPHDRAPAPHARERHRRSQDRRLRVPEERHHALIIADDDEELPDGVRLIHPNAERSIWEQIEDVVFDELGEAEIERRRAALYG